MADHVTGLARDITSFLDRVSPDTLAPYGIVDGFGLSG